MLNVERISRVKKDRFLRSFSEDDFRDRVIRPLLLRLGFEDGRDLCGPSEAGKDAVFLQRDPLGVVQAYAVQTKVGNINLGAKAGANLMEAVTQLKTALATDIIVTVSKTRVRPIQAFLCVSGKINEAARQYILREVSNPGIQFLDAEDLIPRIDTDLPELWLGIDADIVPYFRALERRVVGRTDATSQGDALADGVLSGAASDGQFVALNLHRTIIKTRKRRGRVSQTTEIQELPFMSALGEKTSRILILGEPGSGKSTGLLRLAYLTARKGIEQPEAYTVPILLRSQDLRAAAPASLIDYCDRECRELTQIDRPTFSDVQLSGGRVYVLVDSLDELPSNEDRRFVLDLIEAALQLYPRMKVVVTTRHYRFVDEMPELRAYEKYRISPISWRQAEKIMLAVRRGQPVTPAQSKEMLRRLDQLHGVELNPLLVTVFAASADVSRKDIPANITELFKKYTELMLGRWDDAKGLRQQYQAPLKDFVLTRLAYQMHREKKVAVSRADAEQFVQNELSARGHEGQAQDMLTEVFDRSGLFRVDGDTIEFRHLLIQEFFAGRGIESIEEARLLITDEWWKRPLVFYFGEHPDRIEALSQIVTGLNVLSEGERMVAATTAGLALQACYLSPVNEKLAVWQWVVDTLHDSRTEFFRSVDPEGQTPNVAFVHYYLYGRDSVSLAHLNRGRQKLDEWVLCNRDAAESELADYRMFWRIVGLIEAGDIGAARDLVRRFKPADQRLLLGLHLGAYLTVHVRPVADDDKRECQAICDRLAPAVEVLRSQLATEFGSVLLEWKDGKPLALRDE